MSSLAPSLRRCGRSRTRHAQIATELVTTCRAVEMAFALAAARTDDANLTVAVKSAAAFVARIRASVQARAAGGAHLPLRDRLRLEWLASSVVPGRADARLLDECANLLSSALRALDGSHVFVDEHAKLRLASAEAYSLAHALAPASTADLLFATA